MIWRLKVRAAARAAARRRSGQSMAVDRASRVSMEGAQGGHPRLLQLGPLHPFHVQPQGNSLDLCQLLLTGLGHSRISFKSSPRGFFPWFRSYFVRSRLHVAQYWTRSDWQIQRNHGSDGGCRGDGGRELAPRLWRHRGNPSP